MEKRARRKMVHCLTGGALLALASTTPAWAATQSGCVACHTDEAKLVANLAKEEVKASAKQSGAG